MIDALVPFGVCLHCDEARADHSPWLCAGCAVSLHEDQQQGVELAGIPLRSLHRYEGAASTLLSRAKNPLEPAIYRWLLQSFSGLDDGQVFVPIPTPWRRRFKRRGCHTTCLAELLARRFAGRVVHALGRRRHGIPQAALGAEARRQLPGDTFRMARRLPEAAVVLVDDVITTGSTLRAALNVLEPACRAQQLSLSIFALARVP